MPTFLIQKSLAYPSLPKRGEIKNDAIITNASRLNAGEMQVTWKPLPKNKLWRRLVIWYYQTF
jgi:hypothetical protein